MAQNPIVQVQVFGTQELMAKLQKLQNFMKSPRLKALCNDAGEAYRLLAYQAAPKDTRTLAASIGYLVENFGTPDLKIKIGFDERASRWAQFVEFGSGESTRYPRMKRWMHWFTQGDGKTVQTAVYGLDGVGGYKSHFAKKVKHPGTKAQPFFFKHMPTIREKLVRGLQRLIQEELDSAGRGTKSK
jgi:hypothetical protein